MLTVTTTQRTLLDGAFQNVCVCVEIDATTPIRLTTWSDAVAYDGDTYLPSDLRVSDVVFNTPKASSASFSIGDLDGTIRTAWYAEQFSQFDVNLYQLHLGDDGSWTVTQSVTWKCSTCTARRDGTFAVRLTSAGGLRQRAGLITGSRELFPHAPVAGTPIKIGAVGITVPAGPRSSSPPPGGFGPPAGPRTATNTQNPTANHNVIPGGGPGPRPGMDTTDDYQESYEGS